MQIFHDLHEEYILCTSGIINSELIKYHNCFTNVFLLNKLAVKFFCEAFIELSEFFCIIQFILWDKLNSLLVHTY